MVDEVVVLAKREVADDGSAHGTFYARNIQTNRWSRLIRQTNGSYRQEPLAEPPTDAIDDPADASDTVVVTASSLNSLNCQFAAANVLTTLNRVKAALKAANPSQRVTTAYGTSTVAELITLLENSTYSIVETQFANGGVGEARRLSNGGAAFKWYFAAFDGDLSNYNGMDYADPAWSNNQGMNAIILHDIGHVTPSGAVFNSETNTWYDKAVRDRYISSRVPFQETRFWANNEAMANAFANSLANAIGTDISGWAPAQGFTFTSPQAVYNYYKNP